MWCGAVPLDYRNDRVKTLTPAEAATHLEGVASGLKKAVIDAEKKSVKQAWMLAVSYSVGPFSQSELTKMGHPYARRHGSPRLDPNILNIQTGKFAASWRFEEPTESGDAIVAHLYNIDEKAGRFLERGTRYMFARQPHVKVAAAIRGARIDNLSAAVAALLKP